MPCKLVQLSALCAAALSLTLGCAALKLPAPSWPTMGGSAPPGSPSWWKSHKKKAVFEPGKGYTVAGVAGYFDQDGRPINARVAKVVDAKHTGGGLLGDADFKKKVNGLKEQVGLGPDQQQAQLDFAMGEDLFRYEKYGQAAKAFKRAAAGWPDSQLEQDAMYKMAESHFFAAHYSAANNAYEKLIRKYPSSPHLDKIITRQFSIARYWEQYQNYNPNWVVTPNVFDKKRPLFDTIGRSMKVYENIRLNDPTGPLADDAIMATANSYFLRGRWTDADSQYDLLRKEYPRSDHQFDAHILGLQCKLRKYQGPSYDGAPLEEAQVLVKQLKVQFAGELDAEQRQRLAEVDAQLNKELATRAYNMARHYDNLEEFGAARQLYADVVEKYPQTPLANESRERIASLQGMPDRPTSSLEPILDLLPENAERRAIARVPLVGADETRLAESPATQDAVQDGDAESGSTLRR
jgi:outer membrane protein assembly factor BamD (BamD/ComL family)